MRPLIRRIIKNAGHPFAVCAWSKYQLSRPRSRDVFLVTMTGAGTHWVRTMLAKAMIDVYDLPEKLDDIRRDDLIPTYRSKVDRFKYNHRVNIPRIQHSHSMYSWLFRNGRVILVLRDLRDVIVSHYRTYRLAKALDISFSAFLRGGGIDKNRHYTLPTRIEFLNSWAQNKGKLRDLEEFRYEDLQKDPAGNLRRMLAFARFPVLGKSELDHVISFSSLENMKRMEQASGRTGPAKKPAKVREGKIGCYVDYFSTEDRRYFEKKIREDLIDSFGYDYGKWKTLAT